MSHSPETIASSENFDQFINSNANDGSICSDDIEPYLIKDWTPPTQQLILECYQKPRKAKAS